MEAPREIEEILDSDAEASQLVLSGEHDEASMSSIDISVKNKCFHCGRGYPWRTGWYIKKETYGDLKLAASACAWCKMLRTALEMCARDFLEDPIEDDQVWLDTFRIWWTSNTFERFFVLLRFTGEILMPHRSYGDSDLQDEEDPLPAWAVRIVVGANYTDKLKIAAQWLEACQEEHHSCQIPVGPTTIKPTRLLWISSSQPYRVKLVETSSLIGLEASGLTVEWTCLSYRWGSMKPACLSRAGNYANQLLDIPWDSLPATFQDALRFSSGLGIDFMWIDSICIIQDDEADWARESSRMSHYYGGATLTLAAAYGEHCASGLFDQKPLQVKTIGLRTAHDRVQTIFARQGIEHRLDCDGSEMKDLPLLRRGWVFQERTLSRRILYFTRSELQWECMTSMDCQCGMVESGYGGGKSFMITLQSNTAATNTDAGERLHAWFDAVETYSGLDLSYPSDKLPAIASLASLLALSLGQHYKYHFGIWLCIAMKGGGYDLMYSLQWYRRGWYGDPLPLPRPDLWRAPSWSWASIANQVDYSSIWEFHWHHTLIDYAELLECPAITIDYHQQRDRAARPCLRLRGPLSDGRLKYDPHLDKLQIETDASTGDDTISMDFQADYDLEPEHERTTLQQAGIEVFLLSISMALHSADRDISVRCLVLSRLTTEGDQPARYVRIGLLRQEPFSREQLQVEVDDLQRIEDIVARHKLGQRQVVDLI